MPAYGVFARHVSGLELANVHVSFLNEDLRPALACVDVNRLEIDNFKAQLADGVAAAVFENVEGLVVRNSPSLNGIAPTRGRKPAHHNKAANTSGKQAGRIGRYRQKRPPEK